MINYNRTEIISKLNNTESGECYFARVYTQNGSDLEKSVDLVLNGKGLTKATRKVRNYLKSEGLDITEEVIRKNIKKYN